MITGASGLLGSNLASYFAQKTICTGWYANRHVVIPGVEMERVDLIDTEAVTNAVLRQQPDLIVHCAAVTDVEWCENNPKLAETINVSATKLLAGLSAELDCKFVFTSTDSVFDGISGNYSESTPPAPLNSYAEGKVRAESAVSSINNSALIIRSYFYGFSPSRTRSLLEWVLNRAQNGIEVPGFTDSFFSPTNVHDFADAIEIALKSKVEGILHIGSSDRVSKFEFARKVMKRYNCDMSLLTPITVADAGLNADRPRDSSLNTSLLEQVLGHPVATVEQGIQKVAREGNAFA